MFAVAITSSEQSMEWRRGMQTTEKNFAHCLQVFQGHGVIGMANPDLSPINLVIVYNRWEQKTILRPEIIPERPKFLAFLQLKKKNKDEKLKLYTLIHFYSMQVSILSKCSERLSFKGVKSSVCERTCLIYLCVVTLRIIKFSGECCTTLAVFVDLKKGQQWKIQQGRLQKGLNSFMFKLN